MKRLRSAALVGASVAMAAAFTIGPLSIDDPAIFGSKAAFAGNGNGNGGNGNGGNGGGHGNGGSHAGGNSGNGVGAGSANAHGANPNASASASRAGAAASALGALNAAHASPTALDNAAPNSRVGMIAAYDRAMRAALAMPAGSPAQVAARNAAIAAARQDVLTPAANKPLTARVVARVDALLGLPASDPTLGL